MQSIKQIILLIVIVIGATAAAFGQRARPVPTPPPKARPTQQMASSAQLELLLVKSGLQAKRISDGVWVIRMVGKSFPRFQVTVASGTDYMFASVIIANKEALKFDSDLAYKLLRLANEYIYIKVGFDTGNDLFLRTEAPLKQLDADELRGRINRLAAAADQTYEQIRSSYLIR